MPEIFNDARFACTPLDAVENAWMCAPSLYLDKGSMDLQSLASFTVLTQGSSSGTGLIYERWLAEHDVRLNRTLTSHYLVAQLGLTISASSFWTLLYRPVSRLLFAPASIPPSAVIP